MNDREFAGESIEPRVQLSGERRRKKVVVLGNSGIGKSALLVYAAFCELLYQKGVYFIFRQIGLLPEAQRILFHMQWLGTEQSDDNTITLRVRIITVSKLEVLVLKKDDHLVLADGVAPAFSLGALGTPRRCIVAAAISEQESYQEWSEDGGLIYMGPWSKEELYAAAIIYGSTKATVDKMFNRIGGFPMLVFRTPDRVPTDAMQYAAVYGLADRGSVYLHDEAEVVHVFPTVAMDRNGTSWTNYGTLSFDFNSAEYRRKVRSRSQPERAEVFARLCDNVHTCTLSASHTLDVAELLVMLWTGDEMKKVDLGIE